MAVYFVKLFASMFGEQILNVFTYEGEAGGVAGDLASAFVADVLPSITAVQDNSIVYDRLLVENRDDLTDWDETGLVASGSNVGTAYPKFVAWGFRLNRTSRLTRHGHKRFAGVFHEWVNEGGATSTALTALNALAAALDDPIALTGATYVPVIQGMVKNPATGLYEYGPTNQVSSAVYTGITTQNSRKR